MKWANPQRRISRMLHWIDELTSRTNAALVALAAVVIFALALALDGFPPNWEAGFSDVAAGVTLVMLFVIQHTQSRHQLALQLKLDELIRTSPSADDQLVRIEVADAEELDERARDQQALHESLRDGDVLEIIEYPRSTDT
jgi:low affinity Fe/Cu permease